VELAVSRAAGNMLRQLPAGKRKRISACREGRVVRGNWPRSWASRLPILRRLGQSCIAWPTRTNGFNVQSIAANKRARQQISWLMSKDVLSVAWD